jgi:hypothetical protein
LVWAAQRARRQAKEEIVHPLHQVAPEFVAMAHRIVWSVAATTDPSGRPVTRVLHPIWEWDGTELTGWIATSPLSPKARDLAATPSMSLTYWDSSQDTCSANCDTAWEDSPELRQAGWDRFKHGPTPVGYDPAIIPAWTDPQNPAFGVLRLTPRGLRVRPGSLLLTGQGEVLSWKG